MHISFHTALWPLRPLGLDPGRAIHNADPTEDEVEARRAEQHAYIASRFGVPEAVFVERQTRGVRQSKVRDSGR